MVIACTFPFIWIVAAFFTGRLGPDPVNAIRAATGRWAIRLLIAVLAASPAAKYTGWSRLLAFRRPIGVFSLFYALLHLLNYLGLEYLFRLDMVFTDVRRTPHIYAGLAALMVLIPLGLTSVRGWKARLGQRGWKRLHSFVYLAAFGTAAHLILQAKLLSTEKLVYVILILGFLGHRAARFLIKHDTKVSMQ